MSDSNDKVSQMAVSILRTAVPSLWGAGVAWLISRVPALSGLGGTLDGLASVIGVPFAIAVWYAVWRRVEPRLPNWLTRIVLGSPRAPQYPPAAPAAPVPATGSAAAPPS